MTYSLKNVFYLAFDHEYETSDYNSTNEQGISAIDVSAYVDPIAKGSRRGQGLAVYRVHAMAASSQGTPVKSDEMSSNAYALTVKPYTTTGDGLSGQLSRNDLGPASDVTIWSGQVFGTGAYAGSEPDVKVTCEPSDEVPFVCVRDTIYAIFQNGHAALTSDQMIQYRLECAMITLDTATLNQLLRTQTV
tara:strand:- start:1163 stop:1732 length:570 start_codon:yes stop_codon:yes gene_type:complete